MDKKTFVIGFGITFVLIFVFLYAYCFNGVKEVNINFSEEILTKLSAEFEKTNSSSEFVGYLYIENNSVKDFKLIGYKILPTFTTTGSSIKINNPEYSEITIHSHPGNGLMSCWISPIDKMSTEKVKCIYCKNEVKCYEN